MAREEATGPFANRQSSLSSKSSPIKITPHVIRRYARKTFIKYNSFVLMS